MTTEIILTSIYTTAGFVVHEDSVINVPNNQNDLKQVLNDLRTHFRLKYAEKLKVHNSKISVYFVIQER